MFVSCTTAIKKITYEPEKYDKKKIIVKGIVVNSLYLDDMKLFTVRDMSGERIDVVTKSFLPVVGDIVKVKGKVYKNYKYHKRKMLVIVEKNSAYVRKFDTAYDPEYEKTQYQYLNKKMWK